MFNHLFSQYSKLLRKASLIYPHGIMEWSHWNCYEKFCCILAILVLVYLSTKSIDSSELLRVKVKPCKKKEGSFQRPAQVFDRRAFSIQITIIKREKIGVKKGRGCNVTHGLGGTAPLFSGLSLQFTEFLSPFSPTRQNCLVVMCSLCYVCLTLNV